MVEHERVYITPRKSEGLYSNPTISDNSIMSFMLAGGPEDEELISVTWRKHCMVYTYRSDVKAIIHCTAPYAMALASRGDTETLIREMAKFSVFTKSKSFLPLVEDDIIPSISFLRTKESLVHTVVCPHEGVTAFGPDMETAFNRLSILEHYSRIVLLSHRSESHCGYYNHLDDQM